MRLKYTAILGASLLPTMAFVPSPCTGITRTRRNTGCISASSSNVTESCFPPKARDIMSFLSERYGEGDWTKTRNYVYQAKEKLSIQQVDGVLNFLDDNFDTTQIRSILQSSPRILRKNPKSKLKPTTSFLEQLYGKDMFHEAVSRNPDLLLVRGLGFDKPNDNAIELYLQRQLHVTKNQILKMKQTAPIFFQIPLQKIQLVATFLINLLLEGGFPPEEASRVVAKIALSHPHLFHLSVETNLQPRIDFLVQACSLSHANVATLIKSSSGILGLSVDENLVPTISYLLQILNRQADDDAGRQALRKCVLSHPAILGLSQRNIQQKVEFFDAMDTGHLDSEGTRDSLAARIAMRSPVVYSLSFKDNILPTVEFLAKVWGTCAPAVTWGENQELMVCERPAKGNLLGSLLRDYPGILTLSLEGNLQPTFNFYNKTGYTKLDDDWNLVKGKPTIRGRYIAASLFHRLLPRWHFWVERDSSIPPPLHVIAGSTDATYCDHLGYELEQYLQFNKESVPRLKFSSQFDTWLKTGRAIDV